MQLRYNMEALFVAFLTGLFQYYVSIFNKDLSKARVDIVKIIDGEANGLDAIAIEALREDLHEELKESSLELKEAWFVSLVASVCNVWQQSQL